MKHPYYDYTTEKALEVARQCKYGIYEILRDDLRCPTPSIPEAIEILEAAWPRMGFNWLTGTVAIDVLKLELNPEHKVQLV